MNFGQVEVLKHIRNETPSEVKTNGDHFWFNCNGDFLYGCILFYRKTTKSIVGDLVWIMILLGFVQLCLSGMKEMTLPPDQKMTNGNPAFLFWVPTTFFLGLLLFHTKKIVRSLFSKFSSLARTGVFFTGMAMVVWSAWLQLRFAAHLFDQLLMHKVVDSAHLNIVFLTNMSSVLPLGLELYGEGWLKKTLQIRSLWNERMEGLYLKKYLRK
jgi:hypothetical protein